MFKSVKQNKLKSGLIVRLFLGILYAIFYFIGYYFDFGYIYMIFALAGCVITTFLSYYYSDKIVLATVKARPATKEEDQKLYNIFDSLMVSAHLPARPRLYVVEDMQPNAFATGRNPKNAIVCVTTGLLEKLSYYELEGVIAHELSHIANYDILLSSVVTVMVGFIVVISDRILRFGFFSRNKDNDNKNPIVLIIGMILLALSPIFSKLLQLCLSRKREFLADATAVEYTRNPEGLINALRKLEDDDTQMQNVSNATENLFIVSPLKPDKNKKKKSSLFSTHPSTQERIEALENITKF